MLFHQGVLRAVYGQVLAADGLFGNDTAAATSRVLGELAIDPDLSRLENWRAFLIATARRAFDQSAARRYGVSRR
jgi:hypothetical protein